MIMTMKKVYGFIGKSLAIIAIATVSVACVGEKEAKQAQAVVKPAVVYEEVEVQPMFVGGDAAMYKFIEENLVYPKEAKANGVQGEVVVKCMISNEGKVLECEVVTSVEASLDAEALRVVNMMPAFNPGMVDGACVAMWHTVPVKFVIE